jgi:CubicO group peptidase (beta-lactamase class C family)
MADLSARLRELELSGIAVITGPGGVEFEECFGLADRAAGIPITPATRFGLASVTKMFTAATVAILGVDVDAPVVSLLPPERRPSTLRPDVTVHHLLCHTSHIAD